MPQTRGTLSQLSDNVDRRVFVMLDTNIKRLKPIWKQYTKVEDSTRMTERALSIVGFGDVPEKAEGAPYVTDILRPGPEKIVTHTEFGLGFEVTKTALEDDRHDQLTKYGTWLTFSANYVMEKRAANLFNNGFTTETSADGLSAFNTAHVLYGPLGGTARNRPSAEADLTWGNLRDALIDLATETKHDSGQLGTAVEDVILLVPPQSEMVADRIVNSNGIPDQQDNGRNSIKARRDIKIVVNPLLTDTDAWFLIAANKELHGCRAYERIPLDQEEPMTDARTKNRLYTVRFRYSWYWLDWRNTWGTAGI